MVFVMIEEVIWYQNVERRDLVLKLVGWLIICIGDRIWAKKYPDKGYLSRWKKPWQRPTLPYSCVQYHRRWESWLLSSGWDQVFPSLYCHQENLFVVKESYSLIKNSAWRVSNPIYRKWCQATFLISVLALILRTTTLIKKKSDQANGPISMS